MYSIPRINLNSGDAILTNPNSDRIKRIRALVDNRSARKRAGLFVVEGPQGVREAAIFAPQLTEQIYATPPALARYQEIANTAAANQITITEASAEVLQTISPNAQEILAVVQITQPDIKALFGSAKDQPKLIAILNNARDPGNVGTIIRVADAFGADAVILTGESVEITNPKVVRSTAGSLFHLPVLAAPSLSDVVAQCQQAGMQVLAADANGDRNLAQLVAAHPAHSAKAETAAPPALAAPREQAEPAAATNPTVHQRSLKTPTAWIFGNEAWGLTDADRALADAVVGVPIQGHAESLNLATAATVCLWESSKARGSRKTGKTTNTAVA